ncbi:zinc finger CHY domain-containing protein [Hyaloraphidium curvatum]|nr:zinc finger CHY domain-containing protein [Hyaloraphidium curvatum]
MSPPSARPPVYGVDVDPQTRCAHYHTPVDIVALRFGCCSNYYPCHLCHDAVAAHPPVPWPKARFGEPAVLCGACGLEMKVEEYLGSGYRCPGCGEGFNPGCGKHAHLYFEMEPHGGAEGKI